METLEEKLLETARLQPKYWRHYVDDTFVVWQHGALDEFHRHLNNTCRMAIGGNALKTTVYRKPTATNEYPHFSSHHADFTKTGVIKCLAKRAEAACSEEGARKEEIAYLE